MTIIYLFFFLLIWSLFYLEYFEYTGYYHFISMSSFLGFLSVIYLSITSLYPFSLPFIRKSLDSFYSILPYHSTNYHSLSS